MAPWSGTKLVSAGPWNQPPAPRNSTSTAANTAAVLLARRRAMVATNQLVRGRRGHGVRGAWLRPAMLRTVDSDLAPVRYPVDGLAGAPWSTEKESAWRWTIFHSPSSRR